MLSSDKNVESIARLVELLKDYIILQKEFAKYDVVDKLVRLATALSVAVIAFVIVVVVLFYLSFAVVYWMAPYTGMPGAFAIIAVFFVVLLLLVLANKQKWIEKPLVRILAQILLDK